MSLKSWPGEGHSIHSYPVGIFLFSENLHNFKYQIVILAGRILEYKKSVT